MNRFVRIIFCYALLIALIGCSFSPRTGASADTDSAQTQSAQTQSTQTQSTQTHSAEAPSAHQPSNSTQTTAAHGRSPDSSTSNADLPSANSPSANSEGAFSMPNSEQIISAEVLLISATGQTVDGNTVITAETLPAYTPAPETVQTVSEYFTQQGFEVSPLNGISLTVSGSSQRFSDFFQVTLTTRETGEINTIDSTTNATSPELPLTAIEPDIQALITAATFVPAPDFGPTNFAY